MLRPPFEPGQYLTIRYTERLDAAGAVRSVGSKGDSFDNAAAESLMYPLVLDLAEDGIPCGTQCTSMLNANPSPFPLSAQS